MRCFVTGNKPRRGLAHFLSQELKAPAPELRTPVTDRVAKEPEAREVAAKAAPAVRVLPGAATETQGVAPDSATTTQTRARRYSVTSDVAEPGSAGDSESREAPKSVTAEVRESVSTGDDAASRSEARSSEDAKSRTTRVKDEPEGESDPLYLRLTRKEVRFRDEQMEGLHRLARRLSKARRGMKGDRITDNTLVRVAVDLLLQHADDLAGHDEASLLESLRRLGRKRG